MPTFSQTLEIHVGAPMLFAMTQDYSRRLHLDPFLREARLVGGAPAAGMGIRAWGLETEYVSFDPPRVAAVRMTRGPALLAAFAGSWRFDEVEPGRTRVTFTYHVLPGPRWLRPVLHVPVLAYFRWETRRRLAALKSAAEAKLPRQP